MSRAATLGAGLLLCATIVAIVARDYPSVGHDYRSFIPHLIDTDLHLRINGPIVQWYSPSFGGGLPAFPNPQHLEYSLVQALTLVVNPWSAVLASLVIFSLVGFAALMATCRESLALGAESAMLAGLWFVGSGFYIEHAVVGHVGFQTFPLIAVLLWCLLAKAFSWPLRGALGGLVMAAMLYHAGFYILIIGVASIAISLPLVFLIRSDSTDVFDQCRAGGVALITAAAMAAPKVFSTLAMMRQFPRIIDDHYAVSTPQAIVGFVAQLAGAPHLTPIFALLGIEQGRVANALLKLTGADVRFGIWEVDIGLSPTLMVCLLGGLVSGVAALKRRQAPIGRSQWIAIAAIALLCWIVVEATLARGIIYPVLKGLPILKSLHVNHRLAAIFILPLSIAGAFSADHVFARRRSWATAIVLTLTLIAPLAYFALPTSVQSRTYDVSVAVADYKAIRAGERFAIDRIADIPEGDTFRQHASSLTPYDPLFGYANEFFAPETRVGVIRVSEDGYWNMTNPSGMVFPDLNGVRPFERIREDDAANLDALLSRRQPDWAVPRVLTWLGGGALATAAANMLLIVAGLRRRAS